MQAKVKLTYSVEVFVKADNMDQLQDWLNSTTPREAKEQAKTQTGNYVEENFEEEVLCQVMDNSDFDIDISAK